MRALLVLSLIILSLVPASAQWTFTFITPGFYTTTFPATENPILQGTMWTNGGTTGLDWQNVRTTTNKAFGVAISAGYDDPTAVITGNGAWNTNHSMTCTVVNNNTTTGNTRELELRVRTTITAHSITGYELLLNSNTGLIYTDIVRWNGPLGDFNSIGGAGTTPTNVVTGDVLKFTASGTTLNGYRNGVQFITATDSNFSGGSPGIGFFAATGTTMSDFGFSQCTASN